MSTHQSSNGPSSPKSAKTTTNFPHNILVSPESILWTSSLEKASSLGSSLCHKSKIQLLGIQGMTHTSCLYVGNFLYTTLLSIKQAMALTSNSPPSSYFEKDCREIHRALDRPGLLGQALAHRTPAERQQIKENYKAIYDEDLIERLSNDREVPICAALYMWMLEPHERDAMVARDALSRSSSEADYKALVEIYARRKSNQLFFTKQAYHEEVSQHIAKCDAMKLYGATKVSSGGIDEATVLEIFSKRSIPQLRLAFSSYKQIYGHDFSTALTAESSGEFEESLRVVIQCMCDPFEYYSQMVFSSLKRGATAKRVLTRVMMGSAEVGMEKVSTVFEKSYGMKIQEAIRENIADGDYRDFLLALTNVRTSN